MGFREGLLAKGTQQQRNELEHPSHQTEVTKEQGAQTERNPNQLSKLNNDSGLWGVVLNADGGVKEVIKAIEEIASEGEDKK
jgi:hypothetical protein